MDPMKREGMNERTPDRHDSPKVRWLPARPGYAHAIGVGPGGLKALRALGKRLAETRARKAVEAQRKQVRSRRRSPTQTDS